MHSDLQEDILYKFYHIDIGTIEPVSVYLDLFKYTIWPRMPILLSAIVCAALKKSHHGVSAGPES